jgi:hypothetical protein
MTTIPEAVDALVDVCKAALPDARVDDGWDIGPYEESADGVTVGVTIGWDEDGPAVQAELDREQSDGMGSDLETYRIYSSMFVSWGNEETRPLRVMIFGYYEAIKAALRARHPLAPGVLQARMSFVDYEVRPIEGGWDARMRFTVEVMAFDRN